MSSTTKPFEEKMNASVNHLVHELASIRAGRANPAILDKVAVDYYGSPTPIQQIAAISSPDARTLLISPDQPPAGTPAGIFGAAESQLKQSFSGNVIFL